MDLLDHRLAGFLVLPDVSEGFHFDGIILPAEACFQAETIDPLDAAFLGGKGEFSLFSDGFPFLRDLVQLFGDVGQTAQDATKTVLSSRLFPGAPFSPGILV